MANELDKLHRMDLMALWQHRADLLRDLAHANEVLARRLDPIDDDLAQRTAAFLRERGEELSSEREITQQFIDAGEE